MAVTAGPDSGAVPNRSSLVLLPSADQASISVIITSADLRWPYSSTKRINKCTTFVNMANAIRFRELLKEALIAQSMRHAAELFRHFSSSCLDVSKVQWRRWCSFEDCLDRPIGNQSFVPTKRCLSVGLDWTAGERSTNSGPESQIGLRLA